MEYLRLFEVRKHLFRRCGRMAGKTQPGERGLLALDARLTDAHMPPRHAEFAFQVHGRTIHLRTVMVANRG